MIGDQQKTVHIKNTGRLGELLIPEAKVILQKTDDPKRKTEYDLISVYCPEFRSAFVAAAKAGVEVVYHNCNVEADRIKMTGNICDTGRYRNVQ